MSPEPRRLHRAAIAVYALNALREAAFPLVVVFVVSGLGGGFDGRALERGALYAAAGTAFAAIAGYVRWRTTRWWVTPEAIHHRTGLLRKKETDVPLSRVQALDLEQGPIQRLFSVRAVHVQTGGGGAKGEIALEAIGDDVVRELRELVGSQAPPPTTVEDVIERRLGHALAAARGADGRAARRDPACAGGRRATRPERVRRGVGRGGGPPAPARRRRVAARRRRAAGRGLAAVLRGRRGGVRRLHREPRPRPPADPPRPGGAARGDRAGCARARGRGGRRRAAASAAARRRADRGDRAREGAGRSADAVPAAATRRGARVPGPAAARAGRRPRRPRPAAAAGAPALRAAAGGARARRSARSRGRSRRSARGRSRSRCRPAATARCASAPPAGGFEGGRLAIRSLGLARSTVLAPGVNRESHAIAQTVLQRRARLADLEIEFGKQTGAAVRHLEAATAEDLFARLA